MSTSDVGGLHAKLQRVKAVEQHNTAAQSNFAQSMEQNCSSMQSALQEHSLKHAAMLDHYRHATGEYITLLGLNRGCCLKSPKSIQGMQDYTKWHD